MKNPQTLRSESYQDPQTLWWPTGCMSSEYLDDASRSPIAIWLSTYLAKNYANLLRCMRCIRLYYIFDHICTLCNMHKKTRTVQTVGSNPSASFFLLDSWKHRWTAVEYCECLGSMFFLITLTKYSYQPYIAFVCFCMVLVLGEQQHRTAHRWCTGQISQITKAELQVMQKLKVSWSNSLSWQPACLQDKLQHLTSKFQQPPGKIIPFCKLIVTDSGCETVMASTKPSGFMRWAIAFFFRFLIGFKVARLSQDELSR